MEISTPQDYAERVLQLSQNMHALAEAGDWDGFVVLESQRQSIISGLFERLDVASELQQVAGLLNEVIELDAASIRLGEAEKSRLGKEINTFKSRKIAATTYQKMLEH